MTTYRIVGPAIGLHGQKYRTGDQINLTDAEVAFVDGIKPGRLAKDHGGMLVAEAPIPPKMAAFLNGQATAAQVVAGNQYQAPIIKAEQFNIPNTPAAQPGKTESTPDANSGKGDVLGRQHDDSGDVRPEPGAAQKRTATGKRRGRPPGRK